MIPRYSRDEMAAVWAPQTRYAIWLEIETLACAAQERLGAIPAGVSAALGERGRVEAARIDEIEGEVKHDVIAFLTNLAEHVGEEARFVHQGMTSSDLLDTAFAVQLARASDLLAAGLDRVRRALRTQALAHKHTVCIGRSHGVHAEPTTFGLKMAQAYAEFDRAGVRLAAAREEVAVCAISGPVGTFAHIDPAVEAEVAEALGLRSEPISTQIVPRDRHAAYFAALAVIAGSIERLATEIRHLQRTEVREAEEPFTAGQKGSSAMPHKRNPVLSENLTGLARLVRATALPALENVALWHERDISHSSVERVIAPDATIALDFALHRLAGLIERLVVYPRRMRDNLDALGGLIHSQAVLLALTRAGMEREPAYAAVQRNAMRVWEEGADFRAALAGDAEIAALLDGETLDELFDLDRHLRHLDTIFDRVFGAAPEARSAGA
ncbi:MAG: adenylosuccinate lyase [Alphaproteobacteria bacterium]|nr:adenylosuccinate lyase [Alphaproteobacteria bacterium]